MPLQRLDTVKPQNWEVFRLEAAQRQRQAGVDPADCFEIRDGLPNSLKISTPLYLGGIASGQYIAAPPGSFWRSHDEQKHFSTVVSTHPEIVKLLMQFAEEGLADYKAGNLAQANAKTVLADKVFMSSIGAMIDPIAEGAVQVSSELRYSLTDETQVPALLELEATHFDSMGLIR